MVFGARPATVSASLRVAAASSARPAIAAVASSMRRRRSRRPDAADAAWDRFTTVLPRQYDLVLRTRQAATAEGLDPDGEAVWDRLLEVTRG